MVMSEHREKEWREVIAAIRECYDGTVSYNTDKYQEDRVKWWDCVDVISSSGLLSDSGLGAGTGSDRGCSKSLS